MEARSMKTLVGSWFLLCLVGTVGAQAPRPQPKIQVFVYNYAGVSALKLARAEREATGIFSRAGIETEWLDCPLTLDQEAQYPACQVPVSSPRVALRILSRTMADRIGLSKTTFGSALLPEDSGFGTVAQVCAHCCEELAKGIESMHAAILGHVMAHELGHLLLGNGSHGATGLMHVPWDKKELVTIAQGLLLFTPWEGDKMRRQVSARPHGEVSMQASSN
jgi:hypothetical protein